MSESVMNSFPETYAALPTQTAWMNLPAFLITVLVTILLYVGIKESARVNAGLVIVKLILIGLFLFFGWPHFQPDVHWQNFAPNGFQGIMTGVALVFFAYVGFDAVSTTAEEAKNPQRDLPIGMITALTICTILYIVVTALLTGMAPLANLANEKPVAAALASVGEERIALLISIGVTLTMPTVLLVMQLGQIRILYAMSREGLMGRNFSRVHKNFQTPSWATIVVGLFVAVLSATIDIGTAAELTNIGTLFAFVLVAIGVWVLRIRQPEAPRKFRAPLYRLVCSLCVLICLALMIALPMITWWRFIGWMSVGIAVYFLYGHRHSALRQH